MGFIQSWPSSGAVQQYGVLYGLQLGSFATINLHELQGVRLSSDYNLKGNGCSGALPLLLPYWPLCLHDCLSPVPFLSKTKALAQQVFPLLNIFIAEAFPPQLIASALARGRSILELEEVLEGSYGSHTSSTLTCYQNHNTLVPIVAPVHT